MPHLESIVRCVSLLVAAVICSLAHAAARPAPPTEAEKEHWREHGRTLPTPELLQPTLDGALPAYQPLAADALQGNFRGTSSDVLVDLTRRWIAAFQRHYPKVKIEIAPPFAGSLGAKELIKGDLDFVMVSRELKPDDLTDFRAKFGYDPLSVPICGGTYRHFGFLDAVAFFVHEENPLRSVSFAQLDAILSRTRHRGGARIETWGQLGLTGEWADRPIRVWGVKPWNGFEEFVRQRVMSTPGQRGEWRDGLNLVPTVFPVSDEVARDRYALGYAGLAYVGPGVKLLPLVGEAGGAAIAPGYEEVARAEYPLSRLVFMNVNHGAAHPLPAALAEFMRFILSREGQQVVLDQQIFLPLRDSQARASAGLVPR